MADSLITQVGRDGQPQGPPPPAAAAQNRSSADPPKKRKAGLLSMFPCCRSAETVHVDVAPDTSSSKFLLKPMDPRDVGKKTLVLDLDETLVHSSFKPIAGADFIIPVEIEDQVHQVFVLKRPSVDEFLKRLGDQFEIVVFTASLAKYADPVLDLLDKHKVVRARLFREACIYHMGNYVKDLSKLGRDLRHTIIVDNSPASYIFHPQNAVPIGTWFDDMSDVELLDLIPYLEALTKVDDVCAVLDSPPRE